jgi:metallophosphoesterase (TIGR00282 family)
MKLIMIGDIFARPGREAIQKYIPVLREKYTPDFIIANADNASHGLGVSTINVKELYEYGVDLLTGGDHVWHQKDLLPHLDRAPWVLRPLNYPQGTPGKGFHILEKDGKRLLVIHALGRLFMDKMIDDPFAAIDKLLSGYTMGKNTDGIVVDFHAETTSEKNTLGQYLDGRVSAVVGTHTHIPTADMRIFSGGTAFITDLGMTGDYDSVIGAEKDTPISNFRTGLKLGHLQPAKGEATLCGLFIETDDATGKAIKIEQIKLGGQLN